VPRTKKLPQIWTRLAEPDMVRFRELAVSQDMSYSELVRAAVLYYLNTYDQAKKNELESAYAQQRKADTNRICAMLAKLGIEVNTIIEFLKRMEGGTELVKDCMSVAAKRLDKDLDKEAEKIKTKMEKVLEA
jgi:hypothetical protein